LCGLANWATAQQKFYHLGDFKLENGQVIKDCKIGYRTFGKLNASKSNAVLVLLGLQEIANRNLS
jgi:homoserine O-acetyltransferase